VPCSIETCEIHAESILLLLLLLPLLLLLLLHLSPTLPPRSSRAVSRPCHSLLHSPPALATPLLPRRVGGWVSGSGGRPVGGGKGAAAGDGVAVGVFPRCEADFDGREEYPVCACVCVCARIARDSPSCTSSPPCPPPPVALISISFAPCRGVSQSPDRRRRVLMKKGSPDVKSARLEPPRETGSAFLHRAREREREGSGGRCHTCCYVARMH